MKLWVNIYGASYIQLWDCIQGRFMFFCHEISVVASKYIYLMPFTKHAESDWIDRVIACGRHQPCYYLETIKLNARFCLYQFYSIASFKPPVLKTTQAVRRRKHKKGYSTVINPTLNRLNHVLNFRYLECVTTIILKHVQLAINLLNT